MNNDIPDKLSTLIDPIVKKAVKDAIANHAARGESIAFVEDGKIVTLPASVVIDLDRDRDNELAKK
ncbi:MAG: hypothetical protein ACFBSE_07535 [Prochloraceae cyanobacterium]